MVGSSWFEEGGRMTFAEIDSLPLGVLYGYVTTELQLPMRNYPFVMVRRLSMFTHTEPSLF